MSIRLFLATLASAAVLALPASAQDWSGPGQMGIDLGMSMLNQERVNSVFYTAPRDSFARSFSRPAAAQGAQVAEFDSRYRADPAMTRRVIGEYVQSVRSAVGEGTARQVQQELAQHNFVAVWRNIVSPSGLRAGDMADAMTSYLVLNWEMANGRVRQDHTSYFAAVRAQLRRIMGATPAFASLSNADRQGFAETLMLNFLMQQGAIAHAVRTGDAGLERRLGDAAQQRFLNEFDLNLRAMQLTRQGFVGRS